MDDASFLDSTTSPIHHTESYEKSKKIPEILLNYTIDQENYQPLLEIKTVTGKKTSDISDAANDIPETPKSIEVIDLTTPKKASGNESPFLPTQPPRTNCSNRMQLKSRTCCKGTLDSWINWSKPPPKPKPVNTDKSTWLNVTPSFSLEKQDFKAEINKQGNKSADRTVQGSTLPIISTSQEETNDENDGQMDNISFLSDDFSLPLTPSPAKTLWRPETMKEVSFGTMLNQNSLAACYVVPESQHARSLMRAISSPTFQQHDRKYVDNELTSRFTDDGKVRRKRAERRLLHGFDCRCCADYYEALGLNQDERSKRIDLVSKHRDVAKEPSTPEYYWEIGMPNREEQRRRGQIVESNSPIALKTRYSEYRLKKSARRRLSFSN